MGDFNDVHIENDKSLFSEGFIWLVTSVIVVVLPTMLSYLFRCIAEETMLDIRCYCTDILLILFSISCSVLTLYTDKSKIIERKKKKIGIVVSVVLAVFSGCFYFYLVGAEINPNNPLVYGVIVLCIIYCARRGYKTMNDHISYLSSDKQD